MALSDILAAMAEGLSVAFGYEGDRHEVRPRALGRRGGVPMLLAWRFSGTGLADGRGEWRCYDLSLLKGVIGFPEPSPPTPEPVNPSDFLDEVEAESP